MNADGNNERLLTTTIHCLQCGPDWASSRPIPPRPLLRRWRRLKSRIAPRNSPASRSRARDSRSPRACGSVSGRRSPRRSPSRSVAPFRLTAPPAAAGTGRLSLDGTGSASGAGRVQPDFARQTAGQCAHPRPLLAAAQFREQRCRCWPGLSRDAAPRRAAAQSQSVVGRTTSHEAGSRPRTSDSRA